MASSTPANPVATILLVPFRLIRLPFHVVSKLLHPLLLTVRRNNPRLLKQNAPSRFFPVSGLDEAKAQGTSCLSRLTCFDGR